MSENQNLQLHQLHQLQQLHQQQQQAPKHDGDEGDYDAIHEAHAHAQIHGNQNAGTFEVTGHEHEHEHHAHHVHHEQENEHIEQNEQIEQQHQQHDDEHEHEQHEQHEQDPDQEQENEMEMDPAQQQQQQFKRILLENEHITEKLLILEKRNMRLETTVKKLKSVITAQQKLVLTLHQHSLKFFEDMKPVLTVAEEIFQQEANEEANANMSGGSGSNNGGGVGVGGTQLSNIPLSPSSQQQQQQHHHHLQQQHHHHQHHHSLGSPSPQHHLSGQTPDKDDKKVHLNSDSYYNSGISPNMKSQITLFSPIPRVRSSLWSVEEDQLFAQLYEEHGKKWSSIHQSFPLKTREQVQSHGQYLIKVGKLKDQPSKLKRKYPI